MTKKKTPGGAEPGAMALGQDTHVASGGTPNKTGSALQAPAPAAPPATWAGLPVSCGEEGDALPLPDGLPQEIADRGDPAEIAQWEAEHGPPLTHDELLGIIALRADAALGALENLPDGGPSVDPRFVEHMATLLYFDRLPEHRVIHHAAEAAAAKSAVSDYGVLTERNVDELRKLKKNGGAARLVFSVKQFDRLAWLVMRSFVRDGVRTATNERTFFFNGNSVALATVHSLVRSTPFAC
jgi:hypothetical protein